MHFKNLLLSSIAASLVSAQTSSKCNPLRQAGCPADTALGTSVDVDFTKGESKYFEVLTKEDCISYNQKNGAQFKIAKSGDNPTIHSNFYIMFGRIEATLRAAPGQGIVSSLVLQSDDLDEIDLEWLGTDTTQVQSNYFAKGVADGYDRGKYHPVDKPQQQFHNYTIDWTKDQTVWYINGQPVRTLSSNDPKGYPQTPMQVRIGSWAGGDSSNPQGTIDWAGGPTSYAAGPFLFDVADIRVTDYSTGSEYTYADQSGSWTSIRSKGGKINGNAPSSA